MYSHFIRNMASSYLLFMASHGLAVGSYVDFFTATKTCAASWTWREYLPAVWGIEPNNCEMETRTVLNEEGTMDLQISNEEVKVQLSPSCKAWSKKINCVERIKELGWHKDRQAYPEVTNIQYLQSDSRFYNQVRTLVTYPTDSLKEIYLVLVNVKKCASWGTSVGIAIGVGSEVPEGSGAFCIDDENEYEVWGIYKKMKYTLPTKTITEKKDFFCSDTKSVEKSPSKVAFARSEPFKTLDEVNSSEYLSVGEKSILGAGRSEFACPHGVTSESTVAQAQYGLNWLQARANNLDLANEDVQAVIKYLKALALEKASELNVSQLKKILELHKAYPAIAFPDEETEDKSLETSPESVLENRRIWQEVEKLITTGSRPLVSLEDLRKEVESSAVKILSGDQGMFASLSKSFTFPEVGYSYSHFGYSEVFGFKIDGTITRSNLGGTSTLTPGSAEYSQAMETIQGHLKDYAKRSEVINNPTAARIVDMFLKYLRADKAPATTSASQLAQKFQVLASTLGSATKTLYMGKMGPPIVNILYNKETSEIQYTRSTHGGSLITRLSPTGSFTQMWSNGSDQSFPADHIEHQARIKALIEEVTNLRSPGTDTQEIAAVYDLFLQYLDLVKAESAGR